MENTFKVKDFFEKIKKYNNYSLLISGINKEFEIILNDTRFPHLLGVHYITENKNLKGFKLINYINENNLSDQEILQRVEKYHGKNQKENTKKRIDSFDYFLNNLEKGIIVEKTLKESEIDVNYLIIESNNNEYYQLGIFSSDNGAMLVEYEELTKNQKDIIKSYIIENNKEIEKTKEFWQMMKEITE